ncbi:conserved exported protein of unknown function [Tenacibaculum sp. 190130A14a]|uniref:YD repeat-containing protein n=1 Tax=Tenacibaculum polynesiense TaxID=3137857 RepID=A0ABP1F1L7_9FLAO
MKKNYYLLIAMIMLIVSCSSNEEPIKKNLKLPVKLEQVELAESNVSNYIYDEDNRLVKILTGKGDVVIDEVVYSSGNLIRLNQPGGTADVYEYDDSVIKKHTRLQDNVPVEINEYTYKDGIVITEKVTFKFRIPEIITVYNYDYSLGSNIVKKVNAIDSKDFEVIVYDGKKFPFSGADYLKRVFPFTSYGNVIEQKSYTNNVLSSTTTNTITYDNDDFPVKIVVKAVNGSGDYIWGETRNYTYNQ